MRKPYVFFIAVIAVFVIFLLRDGISVQAASQIDGDSDRVILKFRPLVPRIYRDSIVRKQGGILSEEMQPRDSFIVKVPKKHADKVAKALERHLFVEYAEEDFVAFAEEIPNDPEYPNQWGLEKIDAPGAWDTTHGTSNVDIAILDSGINSGHPDLSAKVAVSVNCTSSSSCPSFATSDPFRHGTHVAGIASSITNNSTGIAGVSWNGRLMSVKVLNDFGSGYYSWIANGVYWATDNGAEVINMSLSGSYNSRTLQNAVNYAWNNGVVVVAAAGNQSSSRARYPARYANSIAVAATNQSDTRAGFSNYGSWVDVAAPGESIFSTYGGGYSQLSGTSMATPHVAGLAGLLFGQNPGWNNSQVRNQIESTADAISGTGFYWVHGRINACSAVGCGGGPTPTPIPEATLTPTPLPSATPTLTPTLTPTPLPTPTSPIPTPTPTPTRQLPWWCRYVPWHRFCQ